ncbi:hypothetical protein [Echinicola shivajiensis]|uniref:hypothetical protein n=1 Tax=Echinicola shivajiensis TaxID=1035916 RepID=UPI001BFC6DCA|nr:hypothetical protein [Echinicola shivajiensis]
MEMRNWNKPQVFFAILFLVCGILSFVPSFEQKQLSILIDHTNYLISYNVLFYALSFLFGALVFLIWMISILKNKDANRL